MLRSLFNESLDVNAVQGLRTKSTYASLLWKATNTSHLRHPWNSP